MIGAAGPGGEPAVEALLGRDVSQEASPSSRSIASR